MLPTPHSPRPTDVETILRVYELLNEHAGPRSGWAIDLALLEEMEAALQRAVDLADTRVSEERASTAVLAARQLIHAINSYSDVEYGDQPCE